MRIPHRLILILTILLSFSSFNGCRSNDISEPKVTVYLTAPTVIFPSGILRSPRGIAVDDGGNLWVADMGNNMVRKIGADGVQMDSIPGLTRPSYMGVDKSTRDVLVVTNGTSIVRINPLTKYTSVIATLSTSTIDGTLAYDVELRQTLSRPVGLDYLGDLDGGSNGDIYVSALANVSDNFVIRVRNGNAAAIAYSSRLLSMSSDVATRFLSVDRFGIIYTAFNFASGSSSSTIHPYMLNPSVLSQSHIMTQFSITSGSRGGGLDSEGYLYIGDIRTVDVSLISSTTEQLLDRIALPSIPGIVQPVPHDIAAGRDGKVYVIVGDGFDSPGQAGAIVRYLRRSD